MTETVETKPAERAGTRRGLATAGVLVAGASAVFGANLFGVRDAVMGSATPAPKAAAVSPFVGIGSNAAGAKTVLRSQPWWQGVDKLQGRSAITGAFSIDRGASQWRAKWSCQTGRLLVSGASRSPALVNAACPGSGTAYSTQTGSTKLAVSAGGPWTLQVDQQVDVPLQEPPLPSMNAPGTSTAARGKFTRIDQTGTGEVVVYRLATGRYAMRLSNFYVTPNVDLQIRLSPLRSPTSTRQFLSAPSALVAPLNITAGSLNFNVPAGVDPTRYRSVVIWCPLVTSAYAQAPLTR